MRELTDAAAQAWPPFALVAGLLAVGAVAEHEGLFAAAAARVTRPGRSPLAVLAGLLLVDALVTAVLNLDTAAAFMTPLMVYAARGLGAAEAPFLYGAVLMANAASLLLPGANLTNLLVLAQEHVSGTTFVARTFPAALAAALVTAAGILAWATNQAPQRRLVRSGDGSAPPFRPGVGTVAVGVSGVLVLILREPALPGARRRAGHGAGGVRLGAGAGVGGPGVAAAASVLVNNLPAATLLSAHPPPHPRALLLGLNLGPNIAVTGSLSAPIWWRAARALGAKPSARTYTRVGAPLGIFAMAAGLAALHAT